MSKPLHIDVNGQGRSIILLHGWGMHGGLFQPIREELAQAHRVVAVDLPGHGYSNTYSGFANLAMHTDYIIEQLALDANEKFIVLGWSMGGLLAQSFALRYPQQVAKLILVAATPSFIRRADWPYGVELPVLQRFSSELLEQYTDTLARFLAIQFLGADNQKTLLREARERVFSRPAPQQAMLRQGLSLLEQTDLREQLAAIRCPTLVINGERDSLVPPSAARYLAERLQQGRAVIIQGAGHAPFLSHHEIFSHHLQQFLTHD